MKFSDVFVKFSDAFVEWKCLNFQKCFFAMMCLTCDSFVDESALIQVVGLALNRWQATTEWSQNIFSFDVSVGLNEFYAGTLSFTEATAASGRRVPISEAIIEQIIGIPLKIISWSEVVSTFSR